MGMSCEREQLDLLIELSALALCAKIRVLLLVERGKAFVRFPAATAACLG